MSDVSLSAGGGDEEFGFGEDVDEGDPNIKPKQLPEPAEKNIASRTHDSITLNWEPIGQLLTKLTLQVVAPHPPPQSHPTGHAVQRQEAGVRGGV